MEIPFSRSFLTLQNAVAKGLVLRYDEGKLNFLIILTLMISLRIILQYASNLL